MFTGLVREIGNVKGVARTAGGARLHVDLGGLAADTKVGDSVAVSGACLTVAELSGEVAAFDVIEETLKRTTLGELASGAKVNLEPAVRAGEPLGGHFVTGHVDGVATCRSRREIGEGAEVTFDLADALLGDVVEKGSISLDGVSLTVAKLEMAGFAVALVPHTLRETTLGSVRPGAHVNVEADLLVKAVRRVISRARGGRDVSLDFLREHGFA
jgi:riboflavin synthase